MIIYFVFMQFVENYVGLYFVYVMYYINVVLKE